MMIFYQSKLCVYNYYVDIDQCLVNNGGCEFSCANLEGINNATGLGYQCGCDYGYQLAPNNHNCNGMYVCKINNYIKLFTHVWSYLAFITLHRYS